MENTPTKVFARTIYEKTESSSRVCVQCKDAF